MINEVDEVDEDGFQIVRNTNTRGLGRGRGRRGRGGREGRGGRGSRRGH